jgi:hypothetical protein
MTRRWYILGLVAIGLLCGAVAVVVPRKNFSHAIAEDFRRGDGAKVDLGRLVDVRWDRMFVLTPYTPLEEAQRELPGPWSESDHDGLDMRDDICVLAFFDGPRLASRVTHLRGRGDFAAAGRKGGYRRSEAVFEVRGGRLLP